MNGDGLLSMCNLTRTALEIPEDTTYEQWVAMGKMLDDIAEGIQWWRGDHWRFGQRKYGESADQAAELGVDLHTLQNAAWVATQFPPERRRPELTHTHHTLLAGLPEDDQERWLDRAEQERMSTPHLRAAVKKERKGGDSVSETVELLQKAAECFERDNPDQGVVAFCQLAEDAWQQVHGLAAAALN